MGSTTDAALWEKAGRHLVRYGHHFQPAIIASAHGAFMTTTDGRRLLDFASGQMSTILGHGHPEVTEVIREQAGELVHLYSQLLSRPVIALAEKLAEIAPGALERVLLLSTGGESNEAALRMAKTATGGHEVLALSRSWHGVTQGAASEPVDALAERLFNEVNHHTAGAPPHDDRTVLILRRLSV